VNGFGSPNRKSLIVPGEVLAELNKALTQAAPPAKFVGGAMGGPGHFFRNTRLGRFRVILKNI
jgi:hypothetical protein